MSSKVVLKYVLPLIVLVSIAVAVTIGVDKAAAVLVGGVLSVVLLLIWGTPFTKMKKYLLSISFIAVWAVFVWIFFG